MTHSLLDNSTETLGSNPVSDPVSDPVVTRPEPTNETSPAPAWGPDDPLMDRVDKTLDDLGHYTEQAARPDADDAYSVEPLDFELPADFKLSVVMPVYNEEATLREIVARVLALPMPIELVIVDDHSTDGTHDVLEQLRQAADIKVIYKGHNEGKGAALRTGFEYVTGDIVVVQDADLEYDPRDIVNVMRPIFEGNADVVYGSRFLEENHCGSSRLHRFGNGMLTAASNLLTGQNLTDMETCYKAFRRDVLKDMTIRQNRFGVEPELTAKITRRGHRIAEVPISYDARGWEEGKKINFKDGLNALWCILRYSWAD
jgi:glycosyltransferase involved in cell wall biosynthesis